ncbi:MAG: hypothetical protein JWL62_2577 [Hyphomicrobiales bacterium]|nr:hypothetical protein [Hyphomicrobiales bacterium]
MTSKLEKGALDQANLPQARHPNLIVFFIRLTSKFWSGSTRRVATFLSSAFLVCLIANVLLAVEVNRWNKYFFDAVQRNDLKAIEWSVVLIVVLGASTAIASALLIQTRMRLQLRWREWLTRKLISRWLQNERLFHLSMRQSVDNPEARIAEDGRLSVDLFVDLAGGIINTLLLSVTFIAVLWYVGGAMTIGSIVIPGYLVIAVVLYSATTSLGMYMLGWPLVTRVEEKAAGEGDFRFALTLTRESAEANKLSGGTRATRKMLEACFSALALRWLAVIGRQTRMMVLSSFSGVIAPAVPLLLGAPKYLSGQMTLGDLM